MKTIGYFFDTRTAWRASFYGHAYGLTKYPEPDFEIIDKGNYVKVIRIGEWQHVYMFIEKDNLNWKRDISGIEYQGIYVDVKNDEDVNWIKTRFRPK